MIPRSFLKHAEKTGPRISCDISGVELAIRPARIKAIPKGRVLIRAIATDCLESHKSETTLLDKSYRPSRII
jgi:hypothetical protein